MTTSFGSKAMNDFEIRITNHDDENINVAVHDSNGNPIEFFRFKEGHPAFLWSDDRIIKYVEEKLRESGRKSLP